MSLAEPEDVGGQDVTRPNPDALMADMGREIRTLRKTRRLTLEELSRSAAISVGLLSQIERGRGNPSFNTLVQLAHALSVPVGRLFHNTEEKSPVVRADERRALDVAVTEKDAVHELLTPSLKGALEAVWVEAPPGYDTSETPFVHPGEEFGIVLQGRHQVILDGVCHDLGPGDSITYASTVPHSYRNAGADTVKAVWVITPPTF